jgi:hypothetical protein
MKLFFLWMILSSNSAYCQNNCKVFLVNEPYDSIFLKNDLHWYLISNAISIDNWPGQIKTKINLSTDVKIFKDSSTGYYFLHLKEGLKKKTQQFGTQIESPILVGYQDTFPVLKMPFRRYPLQGKITIGYNKKLLSPTNLNIQLASTGSAVIKNFSLKQKEYYIWIIYSNYDSIHFSQNLTPVSNINTQVENNIILKYSGFIDNDDIEDLIFESTDGYFLFLSYKKNISKKYIYRLEQHWSKRSNY